MTLEEIELDIIAKLHEKFHCITRNNITLKLTLCFEKSSLSCYSSIDLQNTEWYELNLKEYGDGLNIPCMYSKSYIVDGINRRRKPLTQKCITCNVTPRNADSIRMSTGVHKRIFTTVQPALFTKELCSVVDDINNKYNINISKLEQYYI